MELANTKAIIMLRDNAGCLDH